MTKTNLYFCEQPIDADAILIICESYHLKREGISQEIGIPAESLSVMTKSLIGRNGGTKSTYVGSKRIIVHALPEQFSRHNSPHRCWTIPSVIKSIRENSICIRVILKPDAIEAVTIAIGKGFPSYSATTRPVMNQNVALCLQPTTKADFDTQALLIKINAVRSAARLVDTPPNILNVSRFIEEARDFAAEHNLPLQLIRGKALVEQGLNGIWAVGKAAEESPALVCLRWTPPTPTISHRVAWVGKGIVFDSGGLSIKSKTGMPNMKGDMGGAAAVFSAFKAAVQLEVPYEVYAVLCLAENAVDGASTRPDDIINMHSGKNVEINNTDAEGRLVLADGLSWIAQNTTVDTLIDVATLTGAALVSIGKQLGAIYTNSERLEHLAVDAGKSIGEAVFPLPYLPEFHKRELVSAVADMTNSVKDRANAQSSCAAYFIESHLPSPAPPWLHIDIAGPSWGSGKRGTGFGVGLLLSLSQRLNLL